MKLYFFTALMIVALLAHADAFKMWKGGCKTDSDCKEAECCLIQFSSIFGQCFKRPQEGDNCVPSNKFNMMFQQGTCPCSDGLECFKGEKSKFSSVNYGVPPVCRVIPDDTLQLETS